LYASPDIIRVIKLRKTTCAGDVKRMGERRGEERCRQVFNLKT
jgi:hypothetical protein